jgi:hypothetical protein
MKKSRSCEEQIAYVPRVAEGGTLAVVVFRQIGVAETLLLFTNRKRATTYTNF